MTRLVLGVISVSLGLLVPSISSGQEAYFDSSGVRIRYVDAGSGDPVVLVHGQGGRLETWTDTGILPSLAKEQRVIAIDLRGHGLSDKPHDPSAYGPEMGRDIVRLMDHLKIRRAHIVAYSMGCAVTLHLLTVSPGRVVSAALIGGSGPRLPNWTSSQIERDEAEARDLERRPQSENDYLALAAVVRARRNWVITESQVDALRVPILAIVGTADRNVADVRQFKQQKPSIELLTVEGATHSPGGPQSTLRRRETLDALRAFIRSHAQAATP